MAYLTITGLVTAVLAVSLYLDVGFVTKTELFSLRTVLFLYAYVEILTCLFLCALWFLIQGVWT
jgi:hypothetical protein